MSTPVSGPSADPAPASGDLGELAWIEVIQKMDQVYSDLLEHEVALEEKNRALEESHQFIESVLASISDLLIVCDRNGTIQEVNSSLERFTGKASAQLLRTPVFELFGDSDETAKARELLISHGQAGAHDCELQLRAGNGALVPVSFNWTPRLSRTGKLVGMVVTGRPVGELRRAYEALRQAHDDLKRTQSQLLHAEKMVSLGRLVAGVAHELNNPISFVLGNVLSLRRYTTRLDKYLDAVHGTAAAADPGLAALRAELGIDAIKRDLQPLIDGMIEGAERTRDIVDALKRFSAVDKAARDSVDLADVIRRSVRWVVQSAPTRFQVSHDLPPGLSCQGSSGQLQQVVMNLIQNACDATATTPQPSLHIAGMVSDRWLTIIFRDNGPGIASEHMAHLFEPFFTTKPVGQGTGLGLSISYGIVERHGGQLTAHNHPDRGAVFTLTLPVRSH